MAEQEQAQSDMEKLAASPKTISVNGEEIEVQPLKNQKIIEAATEAEKRGADDADFVMQIVAETLNKNEGFDVTKEEVKESTGNILPLMQAVQEVNGLEDFLEEDVKEAATKR